MPSIKDLFGITDDVEDPEADESSFDLDKFFEHANERINNGRTESVLDTANAAITATDPTPPPLEPEPLQPPTEPLATTDPVAGDPLAEGDPVAGNQAAPIVPRETSDPLSELLTKALDNPAERGRILRALAGDEPAPVGAQAPVPQLPEDIDEHSFEAQLWRENQAMKAQIADIATHVQSTRLSVEEQNAARDAIQAGRIIMERYPEKLSQEDIGQIAAATQDSGLLFLVNAPKYKDNRAEAIAEAMEHTLWTNPNFREKVVETPAPIVAGDTAVAMDRKGS